MSRSEQIMEENHNCLSDCSRRMVARYSEKYFMPWRTALRGWIESMCPMVGQSAAFHGSLFKTVICPFCDTQQYFYDHSACDDCPYQAAGDNIFIDLAEIFKDYD